MWRVDCPILGGGPGVNLSAPSGNEPTTRKTRSPQTDRVVGARTGIVPGCGADTARLRSWLTVAAGVAGVAGVFGFAVSRNSFRAAVPGCRAQTLTRTDAATPIARRLREWADIFEASRPAPGSGSAGARWPP